MGAKLSLEPTIFIWSRVTRGCCWTWITRLQVRTLIEEIIMMAQNFSVAFMSEVLASWQKIGKLFNLVTVCLISSCFSIHSLYSSLQHNWPPIIVRHFSPFLAREYSGKIIALVSQRAKDLSVDFFSLFLRRRRRKWLLCRCPKTVIISCTYVYINAYVRINDGEA